MTLLSISEWEEFLSSYPDAHILQTGAWGELKAGFGWETARLALGDPGKPGAAGAQVLFRRLPLGMRIAYIPKGPVGEGMAESCPAKENERPDRLKQFWQEVDKLCRARNSVFLIVEPDLWEPSAEKRVSGFASPRASAGLQGFRPGTRSIQPNRTIRIDVSGEEAEILARMKQKTRYNLRLAQKKGVVVRASADLETFYGLMALTGERDAFGVHSLAYYRRAYALFRPRGECELLIAEFEGRPLAGLMAFAHGTRAWYFYGASSNEYRELMPAYLLQWEAMRWARQRGCTEYDLWGVPDEDEAVLEANFETRSGDLWGVYRFKRGFGGKLARACGPWERVYNPALYALYRLWAGQRAVD
ncbi:MAG TPA: peptidoglycan bridge formation glycyltransferase FemA/FemB family protein [Anaerolineales bacterium]